MSYDFPQRVSYNWNAVNFGAGNTTRVIRTPKGKRGVLRYVNVSVTTAFVGTATPGAVQLGDGVTAAKYANVPVGAAGAGTGVGHAVAGSDYVSGLVGQQPGASALYLEADTEYTFTFVAPTGGAPAGVGDVTAEIDYF